MLPFTLIRYHQDDAGMAPVIDSTRSKDSQVETWRRSQPYQLQSLYLNP